jgi:archaellum component FlaF (FlaF/FlaG flagellin family)
MEVLIVMALFTILIVSGFSAILSMKVWTNRLADYTAAMAVVEAKVEDIRAATYNPPNAPFVSYTTNLTNTGSIALNQSGAKFLVTGTVVSRIEPAITGHLITVTGTFQAPRQPIKVTLQTVVNKYSGGQQ